MRKGNFFWISIKRRQLRPKIDGPGQTNGQYWARALARRAPLLAKQTRESDEHSGHLCPVAALCGDQSGAQNATCADLPRLPPHRRGQVKPKQTMKISTANTFIILLVSAFTLGSPEYRQKGIVWRRVSEEEYRQKSMPKFLFGEGQNFFQKNSLREILQVHQPHRVINSLHSLPEKNREKSGHFGHSV